MMAHAKAIVQNFPHHIVEKISSMITIMESERNRFTVKSPHSMTGYYLGGPYPYIGNRKLHSVNDDGDCVEQVIAAQTILRQAHKVCDLLPMVKRFVNKDQLEHHFSANQCVVYGLAVEPVLLNVSDLLYLFFALASNNPISVLIFS